MFRTHGRTLIVLGLILGSATGFVRMAQGAEFFSDVVFAGVLMALTVSIIQLAFDWMMSVSHSIRHSD
jgi:lipid A 4'-phosphatase